MSMRRDLEKAKQELNELNDQVRKLEADKTALLLRLNSGQVDLTRADLESWVTMEIRVAPYMGYQFIAGQVFEIIRKATKQYGKPAVRKALDLDD